MAAIALFEFQQKWLTYPSFAGVQDDCNSPFRNFGMAATSLFGIPIWLPSPFLRFFPFLGTSIWLQTVVPYFGIWRLYSKMAATTFFAGISTWLPFTFRESNMATVSFFGISKWLSSPCSGLHCGCNWLSRDFHHGYHILFSGFKNNCHPSFRNSSMAAMSLFGIPIWLPSTILVFAHGYISSFCYHPLFRHSKEKKNVNKTHTLGNAYDKDPLTVLLLG